MTLYRLLYPLRLNADVSLRHGDGTVLQEPPDKGNVIAVLDIYICGVKLAEAMCADALIAQ